MEINFEFKTDPKAYDFCILILQEMVKLFGISQEEALGRMNRAWGHLSNVGGDEELMYHQDEFNWANDIYFGPNSFWWLEPDDLKPMPYP